MRQRADWMKPVDDRILEFLEDSGAGTPKSISEALDKNNNYIGVRCRKLTDYGLLKKPSRGLYTITDDGSAFLEGELDAGTLEEPDAE